MKIDFNAVINSKYKGGLIIMYNKNWDLSKFLTVEREILTRIERKDQLGVMSKNENCIDLRIKAVKVMNGEWTIETAKRLFVGFLNY